MRPWRDPYSQGYISPGYADCFSKCFCLIFFLPPFFNFSLHVRLSSSFPEAGATNNLSLKGLCSISQNLIAIGASGAAAITGVHPGGADIRLRFGGGETSAGPFESVMGHGVYCRFRFAMLDCVLRNH